MGMHYSCYQCGKKWKRWKSRAQLCKSCSPAGIHVNGCQISDYTRKLLSVPFGRKKATAFKTVADVDRAFGDFQRRYSHFGTSMGHPTKDLS